MRTWSMRCAPSGAWRSITGALVGCTLAGTLIGSSAQVDITAARGALDAGRYAEAEGIAASDLADIERRLGRESVAAAAAMDLLVEALLKNGKGGSASTLELAVSAVALTTRQFGPNHTETADSLYYLGLVRLELGEFKEAVAVLEKALAVRRMADGTKAATAEGLEGLAVALIRLERFG